MPNRTYTLRIRIGVKTCEYEIHPQVFESALEDRPWTSDSESPRISAILELGPKRPGHSV